MNTTIDVISFPSLAVAFAPVLIVIIIYFRWSLGWKQPVHAVLRMLAQLMLIGYMLSYIFEAESAWIVLAVICVMVLASSWIALGTVEQLRKRWFGLAVISIAFGGGLVLALILFGVLKLDPWYLPSYAVPLAGMIFANSMNGISLASERLVSELKQGSDYQEAKAVAFKTALIPVVNSLLAVGLVSLPGMMTGQILSGISPLIAVRYQIMVMCMIFASSGISTAMFLVLCQRRHPLSS